MDIDIGAIVRRILPVTRCFLISSIALAFVTTVKPEYQYYLYFSKDLFLNKHEFWRLFTGFFYFGPFSLNFVINLYVFWNYSQQLELNSFYNKRADYLYLIFLVMMMITGCAMLFPFSVLLGNALINTLLYIWSRKNPHIHIQLLMIPMTAPYLPWAYALITAITNHKVPIADLIGIFCGHVYYYFADVLPKIAKLRGWKKQEFVKAPKLFKWLCGELDDGNRRANQNINIDRDDEEEIRRQEELFRQMEQREQQMNNVEEENNDHPHQD